MTTTRKPSAHPRTTTAIGATAEHLSPATGRQVTAPAMPSAPSASPASKRHAAGFGPWTLCGARAVDLYIDSDRVTCPGCRTAPVEAARLALHDRTPANLRRLAIAALRAADDLEARQA